VSINIVGGEANCRGDVLVRPCFIPYRHLRVQLGTADGTASGSLSHMTPLGGFRGRSREDSGTHPTPVRTTAHLLRVRDDEYLLRLTRRRDPDRNSTPRGSPKGPHHPGQRDGRHGPCCRTSRWSAALRDRRGPEAARALCGSQRRRNLVEEAFRLGKDHRASGRGEVRRLEHVPVHLRDGATRMHALAAAVQQALEGTR
jgi:hypothetical protein